MTRSDDSSRTRRRVAAIGSTLLQRVFAERDSRATPREGMQSVGQWLAAPLSLLLGLLPQGSVAASAAARPASANLRLPAFLRVAAPNRIDGLRVEELDDGTTILRLKGTAKPTFNVYRLATPERLVVDIAGSERGKVVPHIPLDTWACGRVTVDPVTERDTRLVRVVVELKRDTSYIVVPDGNELVVTVTPREVPPEAYFARKTAGERRAELEAEKRSVAALERNAKALTVEAKALNDEATRKAAQAEAGAATAKARVEAAQRAELDAKSKAAQAQASFDAAKSAERQAKDAEARAAKAEQAAELALSDAKTNKAAVRRALKQAQAERERAAAERQAAEVARKQAATELQTSLAQAEIKRTAAEAAERSAAAKLVEAETRRAAAETAERMAVQKLAAASKSEAEATAVLRDAKAELQKAEGKARDAERAAEHKLAEARAAADRTKQAAKQRLGQAETAAKQAESAAARAAAALKEADASARRKLEDADAEAKQRLHAAKADLASAQAKADEAKVEASKMLERAKQEAAKAEQTTRSKLALAQARVEQAEQDAARIVAEAQREAERKLATADRVAGERISKADRVVAEAERSAGAKLAEADKAAGAKLATAEQAAGSKLAEAEREAGTKLAAADRAAIAKLAEAERRAGETLDAARKAAGAELAAAKQQLEAAKREADARVAAAETKARKVLETAEADAEEAKRRKLAEAERVASSKVAAAETRARKVAEDELAQAKAEAQRELARAKAAAQAEKVAQAEQTLARLRTEQERSVAAAVAQARRKADEELVSARAKIDAESKAELAKARKAADAERAAAEAIRRDASKERETAKALYEQAVSEKASALALREKAASEQASAVALRQKAASEQASAIALREKAERALADAATAMKQAEADRSQAAKAREKAESMLVQARKDADAAERRGAQTKAQRDAVARAEQVKADAEDRHRAAEAALKALEHDHQRLETSLAERQRMAASLERTIETKAVELEGLQAEVERAKLELAANPTPKDLEAARVEAAEAGARKLALAAEVKRLSGLAERDAIAMRKTAARAKALEGKPLRKRKAAKLRAQADRTLATAQRDAKALAEAKQTLARVEAEHAARNATVADLQSRLQATADEQELIARNEAARREVERAEEQLRELSDRVDQQRKALVAVEAEVGAAKTELETQVTEVAERRAATAPPAASLKPAAKQRGGGRVADVRFESDEREARVIVQYEGAVAYERMSLTPTIQMLRFTDVALAKKLQRSLDASAYQGPVKMITSFVEGDDAKIVVSTHAPSKPRLEERRDALVWHFPRSGEGGAKEVVSLAGARVGGFATAVPNAMLAPPDDDDVVMDVRPSGGRSRWRGERIDIELQDAPIKDVLLLFSDIGRVNIIAGNGVEGTVSMRLNSVPWDQALDIILRSLSLGSVREGNVIRVATLDALEEERRQAIERANARVQLKPLETRLLPVSYATVQEMVPKVQAVLSPRGTVTPDARTNTLIIMDVADNIALAEQLVRNLDTQTPQVLIEARIVEARTNFTRDLGIQWGFDYIASPGTGNPTGILFPNSLGLGGGATGRPADTRGLILPGASANPNYAVDLPAPVGTGSGGALGFSFGSISGNLNTNLRLSAAETTGEVRIISAPKIVTLDNSPAQIEQGVQIPISQVSAQGVNTRFVRATLSLQVTPHVTNEGAVLLDVVVQKNEADFVNTGARGDPTILTKQAQSRMLVNDSDTAVIGGIYTRNKAVSYAKVPWLADIPIIGWFFKNKTEADTRSEVLIFLTPKIVNRASSIGG